MAKVTGKQGAAAALAIFVAAAAALPDIKKWEGLILTPQPDRLAYDIPNVCYGETRVEMRTYTAEECEALAKMALTQDFGPAVVACVPALGRPERKHQLMASMLLSYNIGKSAFCRSTVARRFNAGDIRGGCDAMLMWRFAGGREVRGLLNRRRDERRICLEGV